MRKKSTLWLAAAVCVFGFAAGATRVGAAGQQTAAPAIKPAPYSAISPVDGKENFGAYCAVCHGLDGKGGGPAAPAMKAPMPDLTSLAARNKGAFDGAAVEYVVRGTGKTATPAHGSAAMPVWGPIFAPTAGDRASADVRIRNLVQYVASIQQRR
jgi:mono/diheme cytochrome c family protein